MSDSSDQSAFVSEQYRDTSKLNARIQLYSRFSTNKCGWHRWVFDHLRLPLKCRILELGCGTGVMWQKNLDRIPDDWDITLTDFSPGMFDQTRKNLGDGAHRFAFEVVDAQSIPFATESFDIVIANHMLYHLSDMATCLSEICRVLKPGGRLYASTVSRNHMCELYDMLRRCDLDGEHWPDLRSTTFVLENGQEILSEHFASVVLHRYENTLAVTEMEPLAAYAEAMTSQPLAKSKSFAALKKLLHEMLDAEGTICLTEASGMFEATGPAKAR